MNRLVVALPFDYVARGAAGLLLAAPITAAVAATGIGGFPEGDRLLFQPGGLYLIEALRAAWPLMPPLAAASLGTAALVAVALVVPQAVVWTALAGRDEHEPVALFFARALGRVPGLLALAGLAFLSQVLVLGAAFGLLGAVHGNAWGSTPGSDLAALGIPLLGGALALCLGIVRDLSGAALVHGAPSSRTALRAGLACFLGSPGRAVARWVGPALLGLSLVGAAGLAAGALDVGKAGLVRFAVVVVVHQAALAALVGTRAAWFSAALELSSPRARARGDTPARSAGPADPS